MKIDSVINSLFLPRKTIIKQDEKQATYFSRRKPSDSEITIHEIKTKSSPTLTGKDYGSALFRRRTARLNTWINSEGKLIREF